MPESGVIGGAVMAQARPASTAAAAAVPSERITSVDALRGFDMFWIVGGDQLAHALANFMHYGNVVNACQISIKSCFFFH